MRLLVTAVPAFIGFAGAAAQASDFTDCTSAVDPDRAIPSCSSYINRAEKRASHTAYEIGYLSAAYLNRGDAYASNGDYDRAIADYDRSIKLYPHQLDFVVDKRIEAYVNRGIQYGKSGQYDEEIASETKALTLLPPSASTASAASALFNRGSAYENKGDHLHAIADEGGAIEIEQTNGYAYYVRALAHAANGDSPGALADFRVASQLLPTADELHNQVLARVAALEKRPFTATPRVASAPTLQISAVASGRRVALVIGNGAYISPLMPRLRNPSRDAEAMATILKKLGFEVDVVTDATKEAMESAFVGFARKARDADVTLLFYAGHGLQDQGKNYLVPIDATLSDEIDLRQHFVKLDDVIDDLANAKGARIFLLDACRDNGAIEALRATLPKTRSAGLSRGLARVPQSEGQLVAFATQSDRVAADGEGADSPFTTALLAHLADSNVELRTALTRVRIEVAKTTNNAQIPEVSDSLLTELYLDPTSPPAGSATAPPDAVQTFTVFDGSDPSVFESSESNPVRFDKRAGFARISSSVFDPGVRAAVGPWLAKRLAGRSVRVTLVARSAPENGATALYFAFEKSQSQMVELGNDFGTYDLDFRVPALHYDTGSHRTGWDRLFIEPGNGDGKAVDIQSIRITVLTAEQNNAALLR
jgi:uncharacterized caspase-like protein